jgi:hypothetical protein
VNASRNWPRRRIGRNAAALDTREAYQQFLAQYPSGKWAREAQIRIENFALGNAGANGGASARPRRPRPRARPARPRRSPKRRRRWPRAAADSAFNSAHFPRLIAPTPSGGSCRPNPRARSTVSSRAWWSASRGGKTIYRLQAEVRDEAQARAICGGLKVANKPCVPVLPPAH